MASEQQIAALLVGLINHVRRPEQFPAKHPAASELVATDPFAFALAISLMRGIAAEIIWTFPYDLRAALGHLDPARIAATSPDDLDRVIRRLPNKPRYVAAAPRTVRDLSRLVVEEYERRKATERGTYWKNAPWEPKEICRRFGDIVTALSTQHDERQKEAAEFEAYKKLRGWE